MVFSSSIFLFYFLPVLLLCYFALRKELRNTILLLFSLFFYAWGEPKYILLMLGTILANYLFGLWIGRAQKGKKALLAACLTLDLGCLFVFKYLNFAVDVLNRAFSAGIDIKSVALPIGISFYTFQIMSYVIDVYRGETRPQRSLWTLALYVSLFPQLIAGPIVRYSDVERQIRERECNWEGAYTGLRRFALGFAKKVLLADRLSPLADAVFAGRFPSVWAYWLGALAYSLQIYYDFSGYSDMAIGLGKVFGFDFLENFNFPYASHSVQEFWRRWHISLSSWFRDYLYIPLGGSRCSEGRTYFNLTVVFLLTGFWHGAGWNFLVWGLYYAVFLVAERAFLRDKLERLPEPLRHLYTLLVVLFGWVLFRADDLAGALRFVRCMFVPFGKDVAWMHMLMNREYWCCLAFACLCAVPYPRISEKIKGSVLGAAASDLGIFLLFALAICTMVGSGYSPFLYFRF